MASWRTLASCSTSSTEMPAASRAISTDARFISLRRQLLLRHHFARQLARHHFAYLTAFLCRIEHGVSRAVVLGGDGYGFAVDLIDRRIVGIEEPHGNVPVVRAIGGDVRPDFVIGDPAFFLGRIVHGPEVLAKILPERIALSGLDVVVGNAP